MIKKTSQKKILNINLFVCLFVFVQLLSRVQFFVTPWTVAHQAPLFMEFSWQEYWAGLLFPTPGDLPYSRTEPTSLMSAALVVDFLSLHQLESP